MSETSGKELVLVLGGARSGKSSWALRYTREHYNSRVFLATAEVLDEEMAERVRLHRESRGPGWKVVEEPLKIVEALKTVCVGADAVIIDCMTVWLSNVLLQMGEEHVAAYQDRLMRAFSGRDSAIIVVANEVGTGIVPVHALGRKFRDIAGLLNQKIAAKADRVVLMVAGLPMCLKGTLD